MDEGGVGGEGGQGGVGGAKSNGRAQGQSNERKTVLLTLPDCLTHLIRRRRD